MALNPTQRLGLFVALAAALLTVALHFPFDGYVTERHYSIPSSKRCPNANLETLNAMGAEAFNAAMSACQERAVSDDLPVNEWQSRGAAVSWLVSPIHAVVSLLLIAILALAWVWAARPLSRSTSK